MNKRTIAMLTIATQLLIPGFAVAVKDGAPEITAQNFPPLPSKQAVSAPQAPLASSGSSLTVASQATTAAVEQPVVPAVTQAADNSQVNSAATTAAQTAQAAVDAPAANNNNNQQVIHTLVAVSNSPETATPATTATTTVRFSLKRADYTPKAAYVPDQVRIGIGYDAVISEVVSLDVSKVADTKLFDGYRDRTGKALRDIYFYLDKSMKAKRYTEAKSYLEKIQLLAFTAQEKGILSDDRKDNVVAWVRSYSDAIDAFEKERTQEIDQLRKYKMKESEQAFNWHALATHLGLQDDYEQAITDFENLDRDAAEKNKSSFVQTTNELITYLTQQSNFNAVERAISASIGHEIIPGSDELINAYQAAEEQKRKTKNVLRKLVTQGLQEAAHLTALQNQIRAVADEHYSAATVKTLGEQDEINYTTMSIAALYHLLQKPDVSEKSEQ